MYLVQVVSAGNRGGWGIYKRVRLLDFDNAVALQQRLATGHVIGPKRVNSHGVKRVVWDSGKVYFGKTTRDQYTRALEYAYKRKAELEAKE